MRKVSLQVKITLLCMSVLVISCLILSYASILISNYGVNHVTTVASDLTNNIVGYFSDNRTMLESVEEINEQDVVFTQKITQEALPYSLLEESNELIVESIVPAPTLVKNVWKEALSVNSEVYSIYADPMEASLVFSNSAVIAQDKMQSMILVMMIVVVMIGCLLIYLLVRRMVQPIHAMSETIGRIDESGLSERVEEGDSLEAMKLGQSLNTMMEKLDDAFEKQKRFTSDAAHELKTPLASIQVNLDSIQQSDSISLQEALEVLDVTKRNVQRLSSLTEGLLQLNRSSHVVKKEPFILNEVAEDVLMELAPLIQQQKATLHLNAKEEVMLYQDQQLLRRVLFNLVDNALKYSPLSSEITLTLQQEPLMFSVANPSEPITEEQLKQLFDPFFRLEESRSRSSGGSGLGLAICKEIMDQLAGKLEASWSDGIFKIEGRFL